MRGRVFLEILVPIIGIIIIAIFMSRMEGIGF